MGRAGGRSALVGWKAGLGFWFVGRDRAPERATVQVSHSLVRGLGVGLARTFSVEGRNRRRVIFSDFTTACRGQNIDPTTFASFSPNTSNVHERRAAARAGSVLPPRSQSIHPCRRYQPAAGRRRSPGESSWGSGGAESAPGATISIFFAKNAAPSSDCLARSDRFPRHWVGDDFKSDGAWWRCFLLLV